MASHHLAEHHNQQPLSSLSSQAIRHSLRLLHTLHSLQQDLQPSLHRRQTFQMMTFRSKDINQHQYIQ
jgi:hypothetical protein